LLTLMKGQPLAYNEDNQEDKEPLFDTVDTLTDTLRIFAEHGAAASPSSPTPWSAPRAKATPPPPTWPTTWSKKGLAFRDAHEVVAHAVKTAIAARP